MARTAMAPLHHRCNAQPLNSWKPRSNSLVLALTPGSGVKDQGLLKRPLPKHLNLELGGSATSNVLDETPKRSASGENSDMKSSAAMRLAT